MGEKFKEEIGNEEICPSCGTINIAGSKFCTACGSQIKEDVIAEKEDSPFKKISELNTEKRLETDETGEISAFAHGLPEWSLEPAITTVRRPHNGG